MDPNEPIATAPVIDSARLRRVVSIVALLNFAYFFVEFAVALAARLAAGRQRRLSRRRFD